MYRLASLAVLASAHPCAVADTHSHALGGLDGSFSLGRGGNYSFIIELMLVPLQLIIGWHSNAMLLGNL